MRLVPILDRQEIEAVTKTIHVLYDIEKALVKDRYLTDAIAMLEDLIHDSQRLNG